MKKSLLAMAITVLSLTAYAQNHKVQEEYIVREEIKVLEIPLTDVGQDLYGQCLMASEKGLETIKGVTLNDLSSNCQSVAMVLDGLEDTRQLILNSITEKDFDTGLFISANEDLYAFKLEMLASFLIESPNEKSEIIKLLNESGVENQKSKEVSVKLEELDVKYKSFVINDTLYKNLKDSYILLKSDKERILSLKEASFQKELALYNKMLANNPDKSEAINTIITNKKEGYDSFFKTTDFYLNNLEKYFQSKAKVNQVYHLFNHKNPMYLETLPKYTNNECQILQDWKLDTLAKEKWQIDVIPGCKK